MTIEEMPPIAFSLHKEPSKIPKAIKRRDVTKLISMANTILILKIEGSISPPTKKNNRDWTNMMGIMDRAYEKMNSYDLAFDTYSLVKKDVDLSMAINSPTNSDMKLWANTTIPGAKYLISNWDVNPWNMK